MPTPFAVIRLHRENCDHEISRKSRMAEERATRRIAAANSTHERDGSQRQNQNSHGDVYGHQCVQRDSRGVCGAMKIKIAPVRSGPDETKSGLNRGAKRSFARSEFVEHPAEIKRNNSPNQFGIFKWDANQIRESRPITFKHIAVLTT